MTKFNSFLNPIKIKPEDQSEKFISGDELGYNEKGQVKIIKKEKINLYEITQSFVEEQTLANQLKRINQGLQTPLQANSMDITTINPDEINADSFKKIKQINEEKEKLERMGLDTKKILQANEDEINQIVKDYVKKQIELKEGQKNEQQ